jgi:YggT family protein
MVHYVLAQFTAFLADALNMLLTLYLWIVIAAAVLSWVSPDPRNPIVRFLYSVTEPVLYQVRRRLPFVRAGGIDFSPLVIILAIMFAQRVVVGSLRQLAVQIIQGSALRAVVA